MKWNDIKKKIQQSSEAAFTSIASVGNDLSSHLSQTDWFRSLNDYTSEISKSMDSEFLKQGISKVMQPVNHRILDGGHDFFTTIEKAREIGEQNGWSDIETFQEWAASYFTDLSSNAGMPMFGKLSDEIYNFLRALGISEADARDFVTINGQEALETVFTGGITAVAFIFHWKREDKEAFSRTLGCVLTAGATSLNPAVMLVGIIALGFGYNKLVCRESAARGVITSSVGLAVSAIIPGPVLLGLVPAIVASVYVNKKMGTDFKPIEYSKQIYTLLRSDEFQKTCLNIFEEFKGKSSELFKQKESA